MLDKTRQWRFLGGRPEQGKTVAEIPAPVRDYLIALRDQLLGGEGPVEPEAAQDGSLTDDGKKRKPKSKEDSKFDKLKSMFGEDAADGDTEFADDAEPASKEKQGREGEEDTHDKHDLRKKKSEANEKFDKLKAMFADDDEEEGEVEKAREKNREARRGR